MRVLEKSGVTQSDTSLPSFITMDSRSGYMNVYTTDIDNLGWYVLEITATLDVINNLGNITTTTSTSSEHHYFLNTLLYESGTKVYATENPPPNFIYASTFNITLGVIEVNSTSVTVGNSAPYLIPHPGQVIKIIAARDFEYKFGEILDWEGNSATASIQLGNAKSFVNFDAETLTMSAPASATDQETQPVFSIKLTLTDDDPDDP